MEPAQWPMERAYLIKLYENTLLLAGFAPQFMSVVQIRAALAQTNLPPWLQIGIVI